MLFSDQTAKPHDRRGHGTRRQIKAIAKQSVKQAFHWWRAEGYFGQRFAIGILFMVIAVIAENLSSPVARLWFGLLILSALLVAVLLRAGRKDGEL